MSVKQIPSSVEYICDGCGSKTYRSSNDRPPYWSTLKVERDAYDYQGFAVADASIVRNLCENCSEIVTEAINGALKRSGERPSEQRETG